MAYSFGRPSWLLSLLLVSLFISFSSARPSMKDINLINSVCSITQNQPQCLQTLQSDPRSASADLAGLGQISIALSLTTAKQTSALIASLSKGVTDPTLKGRYDTCAELYGNAIDDLNEAQKALNAKDIGTFRIRASAALDEPSTCDDSFEGPPAAPAQLLQANKKLEGIVSIILAVGARLAGSK